MIFVSMSLSHISSDRRPKSKYSEEDDSHEEINWNEEIHGRERADAKRGVAQISATHTDEGTKKSRDIPDDISKNLR